MYASVVNQNQDKGGIYVLTDFQDPKKRSFRQLPAPPRTQGHPFTISVLRDGTLVCTYSGRMEKVAGKEVFTPSSGVFVLKPGAGATWEDVSVRESAMNSWMDYWTKDLVIDPHDPTQNTWYVAVHSHWGEDPVAKQQPGGLYRTTTRGQSIPGGKKAWKRIFPSYRVSSCTINPLNRNQMYVTTTDGLWYTNNLQAEDPVFTRVDSYPVLPPLAGYSLTL